MYAPKILFFVEISLMYNIFSYLLTSLPQIWLTVDASLLAVRLRLRKLPADEREPRGTAADFLLSLYLGG